MQFVECNPTLSSDQQSTRSSWNIFTWVERETGILEVVSEHFFDVSWKWGCGRFRRDGKQLHFKRNRELRAALKFVSERISIDLCARLLIYNQYVQSLHWGNFKDIHAKHINVDFAISAESQNSKIWYTISETDWQPCKVKMKFVLQAQGTDCRTHTVLQKSHQRKAVTCRRCSPTKNKKPCSIMWLCVVQLRSIYRIVARRSKMYDKIFPALPSP